LADDFGQRPGTAGHQVGGLQHHAVAEGQRGCDLPGRNGNGEVPGGDEADDADRLAGDFHADVGAHRGHDLAREAQAFAGEELEDVAGAGGFADAFGAGLAFFARKQGTEFFLAGEDFAADLVERIGACLDAAGGPGREGGGGSSHGIVDVRGITLRVLAQHVGQVAGVEVGAVACAGTPFAANQVVEVLHECSLLLDEKKEAGHWVSGCGNGNGRLNLQRTRHGFLLSKVHPGIRYCMACASLRAPSPCFR
jgi:hypothetical protein